MFCARKALTWMSVDRMADDGACYGLLHAHSVGADPAIFVRRRRDRRAWFNAGLHAKNIFPELKDRLARVNQAIIGNSRIFLRYPS